MKLLLDQNLSRRIPSLIHDLFNCSCELEIGGMKNE